MFTQGRAGMLGAFVVGLAVATAGTATASKLITGKQIKNGSITREGLSRAIRTQLATHASPGPRGEQGPQCSPGAQGVQGLQGEKGDQGEPGAVPSAESPTTITSLSNGWQSWGAGYTPRYWRDPFNVVHLMGGLKGGTVSVGTDSVMIFRLPPGYRPSQIQYFPIVSTNSSNVPIGGAYLEVCGPPTCAFDDVGKVAVFGADNAYISMDGITFRAG